ncbi:MAG TPA: RidA family protein [Casimicrobiaceae bacterium]|nr:RidA family protein [Casimicrobiaceae bacterium]
MERMRRIVTDEVQEPPPGLWSNCRTFGQQVYISGLVAMDQGGIIGEGDPHRQAMHIFETMRHYLRAAGGQMNDVINLNIYVTDMKHRPAVLDARRRFFSGDFPCSTLVAVTALIDPRLLVEINAVAFVGAGALPTDADTNNDITED